VAERAEPPTGPELIRAIERTLGIGVIVESFDEGPPVSIDARLFFGAHSEVVHVEGATEELAWRALAGSIAAWRTANDKQFPMWPAGGG
jgi:hypothetical protein